MNNETRIPGRYEAIEDDFTCMLSTQHNNSTCFWYEVPPFKLKIATRQHSWLFW